MAVLIHPLTAIKGRLGAHVAYPLAEVIEKRDIRTKLTELRRFYGIPFRVRRSTVIKRLVNILEYAGHNVPYYKDLFAKQSFDPSSIYRDVRNLGRLPPLTKEIVREQGERMLASSLAGIRHHACKTGGSTGPSCTIMYDQEAADYSSAVTLYARERIGKRKWHSEVHFASRFPDAFPLRDRIKESFKCFSMNRTNIFFDRLDEAGLQQIMIRLRSENAYLVHAHPSTVFALAKYVEQKYGTLDLFRIFESSGEVLEPYMRETIERVFNCVCVDRYGLAEFGVVAYQFEASRSGLQVLDSECWPETLNEGVDSGEPSELLFTGFRNYLMPLIRYRTGDRGNMEETEQGIYIQRLYGRVHDLIKINGVDFPTHYIQDVLDRIGGIQEYQIVMGRGIPELRLVLESWGDEVAIKTNIERWWGRAFRVRFVAIHGLVRVGWRGKFRHLVKL